MKPVDPERERLLREFVARLGRPDVSDVALQRYHEALIHRSYTGEAECEPGQVDNERLEFLGDRVLNLIVAEHLFNSFTGPEGELTALMEFTENRNLAFIVAASGTGLPDLILTGKGQDLTDRIIAGSFEAFIAAFYLDAGLEETKEMVSRFFPNNPADFGHRTNYKKILQEHHQKKNLPLPRYELESRGGSDHRPKFVYVVKEGALVLGRGAGRNKTEATQNAARDALERMGDTCREEYS